MDEAVLTAVQAKQLREVVAPYRDVPGALLPVLEMAQAICGSLPLTALETVAEGLALPLVEVAGTAGFSARFTGEQGDRDVIGLYDHAQSQGHRAAATLHAFATETRLILENVGKIDPISSQAYAARGGYEGLRQAVAAPAAVLEAISASGLRGRGGAGFPVGRKWQTVRETAADRKYLVGNADESEPGTFKDRLLLAGAPHAVIEGMAIGGVAVGASKGFLSLRPEYRQVRETLAKALADARAQGYLGRGIVGSAFDFDIELRTGAGAYAGSEETGLLESLEGRRGEPRLKPPYPGVAGLWGKPTVVNNVETLANIPLVLRLGADGYRRYGAPACPGTKLFTLSGHIAHPGVYEFPLGVTLRRLFEDAGGGCPQGKRLQGIQVGGCASGAFVTPAALDLPLDMDSCAAAGLSLGTGSLMFFDEDADVVALCRDCLAFSTAESCQKCTPCRYGTRRIKAILEGLLAGRGRPEDLGELAELADYVRRNSLCGLGQAAPLPVLSALKNFHGACAAACAPSGGRAAAED